MMAKIVIRALDEYGNLLGWTEVHATMREGSLFAPEPIVLIRIDVTGMPLVISHHWTDLDVEWRKPVPEQRLCQAGEFLAMNYANREMAKFGSPRPKLPPVTVHKPVAIEIPTGGIGAMTIPVSTVESR